MVTDPPAPAITCNGSSTAVSLNVVQPLGCIRNTVAGSTQIWYVAAGTTNYTSNTSTSFSGLLLPVGTYSVYVNALWNGGEQPSSNVVVVTVN